MAWNRRTDKYVPDHDVERWEEIIEEQVYASEIVRYLLDNWFGIDDKATFLYDLAQDYDVELTEEEDD